MNDMTQNMSRTEIVTAMRDMYPGCPRAAAFCELLESGASLTMARNTALRIAPVSSAGPAHRYDPKAPVDREARLAELGKTARSYSVGRGYTSKVH